MATKAVKQRLRTTATDVETGTLSIHSTSVPGLRAGLEYSAIFTQTIAGPGDLNDSITTSQNFVTPGTPWTLDPALVDSVYPPQGHSDYYNVLPHVVFANAQVPWMVELPGQDLTRPWLALLSFTEDELTMTTTQKGSFSPPLAQNGTLGVTTTEDALYNMRTQIAQPVTTVEDGSREINTVIIQSPLYQKLFQGYRSQSGSPDLERFWQTSHVRRYNPSGTTGQASTPAVSSKDMAVTVCPRTGPLDLTKPQVLYAHLVSLGGVADMPVNASSSLGLTALVSLYSWTFTSTPASGVALGDILQNIASNVAPLGVPIFQNGKDVLASPSISQQDDWVKDRMLNGYSLLRYRTVTGEPTVGMYRGLLTPVQPTYRPPPSSVSGTELAILDPDAGILDLSLRLAWELGRLLAMADRPFAAVYARIKANIHRQALAVGKTVQATFNNYFHYPSIPDFLDSLPPVVTLLGELSASEDANFEGRWGSEPLGYSRMLFSFSNVNMQSAYKEQIPSAIEDMAAKLSNSDKFASSDWGAFTTWILDKLLLRGVPLYNLIPDPAYLPRESLRTFYVDANWVTVFMDGALSLSDRFIEGDPVRTAIQSQISQLLAPPNLPQWGFFLRSELLVKFPNMRVVAPRADGKTPEYLRMELVAPDTLLVLFDRAPGGGFYPNGIRIQPPEHQLTFALGDLSRSDNGLTSGQLYMDWKLMDGVSIGSDIAPQEYLKDTAPFIFDFDPTTRSLVMPDFANEAAKQTNENLSTTTGLVGSQLLMVVPYLKLDDPHPPSLAAPETVDPSTQMSFLGGTLNSANQVHVPKNTFDSLGLLKIDVGSIIGNATVYPPNTPVLNGLSSPAWYLLTCDVHVALQAACPSSNTSYQLLSVEIDFPYYTDAFESEDCFLEAYISSPGPISMRPPPANTFRDYPQQRITPGPLFPTARFVGAGYRGRLSVTSTTIKAGDGTSLYLSTTTVVVTPNFGLSSWDLNNPSASYDLSFVLEDVTVYMGRFLKGHATSVNGKVTYLEPGTSDPKTMTATFNFTTGIMNLPSGF